MKDGGQGTLFVCLMVASGGNQEGNDLGLLIVPLENCLTFTENVCM